MTLNEMKNRKNILESKLFLLEMADHMTDEERKAYDNMSGERNALATQIYYAEHPALETEEEEEEIDWAEERRKAEEKEKRERETDKLLTLKLWNALKGTNWVGLPALEKKIKENGWE
jgi:hypothetical protein